MLVHRWCNRRAWTATRCRFWNQADIPTYFLGLTAEVFEHGGILADDLREHCINANFSQTTRTRCVSATSPELCVVLPSLRRLACHGDSRDPRTASIRAGKLYRKLATRMSFPHILTGEC